MSRWVSHFLLEHTGYGTNVVVAAAEALCHVIDDCEEVYEGGALHDEFHERFQEVEGQCDSASEAMCMVDGAHVGRSQRWWLTWWLPTVEKDSRCMPRRRLAVSTTTTWSSTLHSFGRERVRAAQTAVLQLSNDLFEVAWVGRRAEGEHWLTAVRHMNLVLTELAEAYFALVQVGSVLDNQVVSYEVDESTRHCGPRSDARARRGHLATHHGATQHFSTNDFQQPQFAGSPVAK